MIFGAESDRLLEDSRPKPMVSVCRESSPDDGTSSFVVLPIASPTISTSPRPSEAPSLCCLMCDGMVAGKKRKCRIWGVSDPTSEMLVVSMSTLLEANSTSRTWNSGVLPVGTIISSCGRHEGRHRHGAYAYVDHHASTTVDVVWRPWEDF